MRDSGVARGGRGVLSVLLVVALVARATPARTEGAYPEASSVMSGADAAVVRSASSSVDTHSGAAAWHYEFALPPGRDGFTPSLALRYSSEGGNSWVGRGFVLDTPMIRRDTRNGPPLWDPGQGFRDDPLPTDPTRATASFVYDTGGGGGVPLVRMGPHDLGVEYRLANDSADTQFIHVTWGLDKDTWLIRTRDGRMSKFASIVVVDAPGVPTWRATYAWRLSSERDLRGNLIEYGYDAHIGSASDPWTNPELMPRLASVHYGGNDGSAGGTSIEHLFHVSFLREGAPVPPALQTASGADFAHFAAQRTEPVDYRVGGALYPSGVTTLLRGIAVQVAWPGSTDETRHEYATRRVRYWTFRYNWDTAGTRNTDQWWPLLTEIHETATDEAGVEQVAPTVRLGYYGWDRTLTARQPIAIPALTALRPLQPPGTPYDGLSPALGLSAPNASGVLIDHGLLPPTSVSRRYPHNVPGRVQLLHDVDGDGLPDLLDLAHSQKCYATDASGPFAQWFRFQGEGVSIPGSFGFASGSDWAWDSQLLLRSPSVLNFSGGGSSMAAVNCGFEPRRWILAGYGLPTVGATDVIWTDLDGDGDLDLVRNNGDNSHATWLLHRNHLNEPGRTVANAFDTDAEALPVATGPWERGTDHYAGRDNHYPPDLLTAAVTPNNGTLALAADFGISAWRMSWSSSEAGFVHDFTGDGRPDRLVVTNSARYGTGALAVYPGLGCGGTTPDCRFDNGRVWMTPLAPGRFVVASPQASVTPDHDPADSSSAYQQLLTDVAVDFNGDGLTDLLGNRPELMAPSTTPDLGVVYMLNNPTVDWSYGAGFINGGFASVVGADLPPLGPVGLTDFAAAAPSGPRARATTVSQQISDYNGDGLPDVISPDGWWLPNSGGVLAHRIALTTPVGVQWAETGTSLDYTYLSDPDPEPRHAYYATQRQFVIDMTGDGRPDIVRIVFNGDGTASHIELWSDSDPAAAPGRLHTVNDGRGHLTEYRYATLAAALRGDAHGVPAQGWVVSEVRDWASPSDPIVQVAQYRYSGAQYGADPSERVDVSSPTNYAPISSRVGVRGFTQLEICHFAEGGSAGGATMVRSTFDHSGRLRDGVLVRQESYGDCTGTQLLARDDYDYGATADVPGTPTLAGDPPEHVVRNRVSSVTSERWEYPSAAASAYSPQVYTGPGGSPVSVRTVRQFSYLDTTTAVISVVENADPLSEADSRVTATTWLRHDDSTAAPYVMVRRTVAVQDGVTGVTRRQVDYRYDGDPDGTFWRGELTAVVQHATLGDAGFVTTLDRDGYGHVRSVSTPAGHTARQCYDRYAMYPVLQADASGLTTERATSYVTGAVLEARGPTGIARLGDTPCPGVESETYWQPRNSKLEPNITFAQPSTNDSATTTAGTRTRTGPGLVLETPPERRDHPADPPLVNQDYERAPAVGTSPEPDMVAPLSFRAFSWTLADPPVRPLPGLPPTYPAPPTAPTVRRAFDAFGRVLTTEATRRASDGSLEFELLNHATYVDGYPSSVRVETLIDDVHTAVSRADLDGFGRVTRVESLDATGVVAVPVDYAYDYTADIASVTGPNPDHAEGGTVTARVVERDARHRPLVVQAADGAISTTVYATRETFLTMQPPGLLVGRYDSAGNGQQTEYDRLGRPVVSRVYAETASSLVYLTTRSTWDAANQLRTLEEPDGACTEFDYDLRGLRTRMTRRASCAEGAAVVREETYAYDDDGRLSHAMDAAGRETVYDPDPFGRLATIWVPDPDSLPGYGNRSYSYQDDESQDGAGQLATVTTPTETTQYTYDARGRTASEYRIVTAQLGGAWFNEAYGLGYEYNRASQPTSTTVFHGSTGYTHSIYYDYDWAGNLEQIWDKPAGARTLAHWAYNTANLAQQRTDDLGGVEQVDYSRAGLVRHLEVSDADGTQWDQTIGYSSDGRGMPESIVADWHDGYSQSWINTFDHADRLRSAGSGTAFSTALTYGTGATPPGQLASTTDNIAGVPTTATYQYGGFGPMSADPAAVFSLTTSSGSLLDQSYDAHGSVTKRSTPATGSQALGVDYQGLLRVRGSDVYLYDSNSQRTHVFHSTPSGGELTATIGGLLEARYTFDGTNFVPTEVLALAGLGDAPVARVRASDGRVSLLHRDAQGSVVLVRRGTSPGVTSERVRFAYEPFGRVLHETGPDRDRELLRYHGGMIDPAGSEFVQFGFRRYDPVSRRWASADPAFADDPYGFNLGNPLAFRDPFGLQSAPSGGTHPCDPDGCGYPRQPPDPREPPEPNGPSRGSASVSTGRVDADSDSESGAFLVGGRDFRPGVELTYAGSLQSHGQTHWIQFGALEWEVQTTHGSFYARVQEPADGGTTTASSPLNRVWFVDNLGNPDSPWYPSGAIIRSAEGMSMFDSPQLGTPMQQAVLNLATRAGWIRNRQDVIALHRRQVFDAYLVHRGQVLARASWYRTWTLFDPFSLSMTYGLVVTGITDVSPASGILEQQRRATLRLRGDARILGSALPVARGP